MDDSELFHQVCIQFKVCRSKEMQQEVRIRQFDRSFGTRMRTLRGLLGLTQRQLASALGISVRTVIRYELEQCRRRPRLRLWVGLRELEYAHQLAYRSFKPTLGPAP